MLLHLPVIVRDHGGSVTWAARCLIPNTEHAKVRALARLGILEWVRSGGRGLGAFLGDRVDPPGVGTGGIGVANRLLAVVGFPGPLIFSLAQVDEGPGGDCPMEWWHYDSDTDQWYCKVDNDPIIVQPPPNEPPPEPPPPSEPSPPPPGGGGGSNPPPPPPPQEDGSLCGDDRDVMADEYSTHGVNWAPACTDFTDFGSTVNFSWSELNGGFSTGNPHQPWGHISGSLRVGLESTRSNYARGGIRLSSGYRCPHGNTAVGSTARQTSLHMHGRAADMYSSDHLWTEDEFNRLRLAASSTGPSELFQWSSYSDRHLHAAW